MMKRTNNDSDAARRDGRRWATASVVASFLELQPGAREGRPPYAVAPIAPPLPPSRASGRRRDAEPRVMPVSKWEMPANNEWLAHPMHQMTYGARSVDDLTCGTVACFEQEFVEIGQKAERR